LLKCGNGKGEEMVEDRRSISTTLFMAHLRRHDRIDNLGSTLGTAILPAKAYIS